MQYYQDLAAPLLALANNTGVSLAPADPLNASAPQPASVDERIAEVRIAITGQAAMPPATNWRMSNRRSASRLDELEPRVDALRAELDTIELTPGPQGPRGNTGEAGPTGLQGEPGAVGPKGDIGTTGPQGPVGLTGTTGPKGDAGPQGIVGAKGDAGVQGLVGPKGDTGLQGPKGDTGATGPAGAKGDTGATGAAGQNALPLWRTKRVATPAMLLSANPVVSVVWDTPFADANYTLQATLQSTNTGLLGQVPTIISQDKNGASVRLNVLLALAAGAGTVHFTAIHD